MGDVLLILTSKEQVELEYPIYQELAGRGIEVSSIETGGLCRERHTEAPSITASRLGVECKSLQSFGTKSMVKILERENPEMIILGSDEEYIQKAFLYAAKGLNIPTLLLDVGFGSNVYKGRWLTMRRTLYRLAMHWIDIMKKYVYIMGTVLDLKWNILKIIRMLWDDVYEAIMVEDSRGTKGCQAIAIAGLWQQKVLVERGVEPDKIKITGTPRITQLLSDRDIGKECKLRDDLGIANVEKVVLFHTLAQVEHGRWNVDMRKSFVKGVVGSILPLADKGVRIIVRLHPVENILDYKTILDNYNNTVILSQGMSLATAMGISDVVLFGGYSTMVLEASALGKISLVLNTFNEAENLPYEEMGIAPCIYRYEDIQELVDRLLFDENIRNVRLQQIAKFCEENARFIDGNAVKRIADLILETSRERCCIV